MANTSLVVTLIDKSKFLNEPTKSLAPLGEWEPESTMSTSTHLENMSSLVDWTLAL
jgi:hypothetical protein